MGKLQQVDSGELLGKSNMFFANGEKLERRLQETITEHNVWRKQSKNKCSGYNKSIEKIVQKHF